MKNKLLDKTLIKFIIVGILNTMVGTGTMFVCYNTLKCNYWVSSAMNYIVGSSVSYFLNKNYTFKSKSSESIIIVRFMVNIISCYIISYGVARPIVTLILITCPLYIQENIAMFLGMLLFVVLNYLGQRFWVFKS